jgi:hypothetical protein
MPHDQIDLIGQAAIDYLQDYLTSIDDIEKATGLNFFPAVGAADPSAENAVEKEKATALWDINGFKAKSLSVERKEIQIPTEMEKFYF